MITQSQIDASFRRVRMTRKRVEIKDQGGRGEGRLWLIVRPVGSQPMAEWYAVFHRGGKRSMVKVGSYPTLGLADARKAFREAYAPLITSGEALSRLRVKTEDKPATVRELFQAYVEHLEGMARPRSAKQARIILLGGKKGGGAAKAIGEDVLAAVVTPQDIVPYLGAIHKRGAIVMARKARTYLSSAFAFGMKSSNSYTGASASISLGIAANPVAAIPADPEAHRAGQRHLSVLEFRALWRWLEGRDAASLAAPVLRLMMATGQRMEEISFLTAANYDRNEKMLDWSRTKNDQPHAIPLPPQAVKILGDQVPNRGGLFFPGRARPDMPLTMNAIEKELDRFVEKTGMPHCCPRDLRRTWKTLAGAAGLSKEIRDRLQNHARQDVSSRHYDRYEYLAEKRAAMGTWAEYLDWILTGDVDEVEQGGSQPISLSEVRARRERSRTAA